MSSLSLDDDDNDMIIMIMMIMIHDKSLNMIIRAIVLRLVVSYIDYHSSYISSLYV